MGTRLWRADARICMRVTHVLLSHQNSDHGIGYSHKSQQVATAAICASTFYYQSSYMLVAGELEPPSSALITAIKPAFFKAL